MGRKCCVPNCKGKKSKSMHQFPENVIIKKMWIQNIFNVRGKTANFELYSLIRFKTCSQMF